MAKISQCRSVLLDICEKPIALNWALGIRRAVQPRPIAAASLLRGRVSDGLRRADQGPLVLGSYRYSYSHNYLYRGIYTNNYITVSTLISIFYGTFLLNVVSYSAVKNESGRDESEMTENFTDVNRFKESILSQLSEKRYVHTMGVRETAAELCRIYGHEAMMPEQVGEDNSAGVDNLAEKADLAVCFHDLYRGRPVGELDELIEKYGISDRYKGNANLAHGKIAAAVMKEEYGIHDEDMINAVSYHTTGREGMSLLEKIVFLADAIEPGRDYPLVDKLREMSRINLDEACLMSLDGTIKFLENQGETDIDKDTLKARDWLREKLAECQGLLKR